jgi:hypothetical protein
VPRPGDAVKAQQKADAVAKQADDLLAKHARAENDLGQLQWLASARYVADPKSFVKALMPFKGEDVASYARGAEGYILCDSIVDLMKKGEMKPLNQCAVPILKHC